MIFKASSSPVLLGHGRKDSISKSVSIDPLPERLAQIMSDQGLKKLWLDYLGQTYSSLSFSIYSLFFVAFV